MGYHCKLRCVVKDKCPNINISDLARETGISRVMCNQIIKGNRNCSLDTARRIVEYVNRFYFYRDRSLMKSFGIDDLWVPDLNGFEDFRKTHANSSYDKN